MRTVAVVAFNGVVPFDLSVPIEVFGRARLADGRPSYRVLVCGVSRRVDAGTFRLEAPRGLAALRRADTVIVPGVSDPDLPVSPALIRGLRAAEKRGARIASICSGAFVLAATGLLDGKRATTHWAAADELKRRHPKIEVDPSVLYVDAGRLLTSAGAAAGLDLCLHLVRQDCGAAVAAETARLSVMPLERAGGQAQFISQPPPPADGASLEPVLTWMRANLHRSLPLDVVARKAAMSRRNFSRRFVEQVGTTPAQWLITARVRRAQQLLETTDHPAERVASLAGFGTASTFRLMFQRIVGTSPTAYRSAFRAAPRSGRALLPSRSVQRGSASETE
jgi:transcriptional regulator GlxA family with amidase domain